jgi:hypothetical protein
VEGVPQLVVGAAAVEEEAVGAEGVLRLLRGQRLLGDPLHPRRLPSCLGLLLIPSHAECWPAGHCLAGSPRPIGE